MEKTVNTKKTVKETVFNSKGRRKNLVNCILAVIIAILFLFPIYWLVAMSFKSDAESFGKIVTYYPHSFTLDPWIQNFTDAEFLKSLKNSMIIALLSMVLSMTFGVPAAYGMGRYRVPGSKGFLVEFSNGHVGMVQRQLGSSSSHRTTAKGRPRWTNRSGQVEKLITMGAPSAAGMHSTVWPLVAEDVVDYLLERLEEQIEKVTARAKARKG